MLTATDFNRIKTDITSTLQKHAGMSPADTAGILPAKDLQGKIYEAHVLSRIIENLVSLERCQVRLINKTGKFCLKQKGSPINRDYPYFEVIKAGKLFGELFTDTEFTAMSCQPPRSIVPYSGDYHELDIVMFQPGQSGRPAHNTVMIAVECKATAVDKSTFREVLGFRRELSLLTDIAPTVFDRWPAAEVNATPASVHLFYSWDPWVTNYKANGLFYGIHVEHETV